MLKNKLSKFDKLLHEDGLTIWYEKESDEIAGMVSLKSQQGQTWICSLYVAQKYRGQGYCRALLDYATFNGGDHISARKTRPTVQIYQNYGFSVYDEDDKFLYMRLAALKGAVDHEAD